MTDNRTTELLCELLDERGIEYETYRDVKNRNVTKWSTHHGAFAFLAVEQEGKLLVETTVATEHSSVCTPEQAIAATLGSEREKALEELVRDWQALYENPDYGDCMRLRKRMQELGIEVIDE